MPRNQYLQLFIETNNQIHRPGQKDECGPCNAQSQEHGAGQTDRQTGLCPWAVPEGLCRHWGAGALQCPQPLSSGAQTGSAVGSSTQSSNGGWGQHCLLFSAGCSALVSLTLCSVKVPVCALKLQYLVALALFKLLKTSVKAACCIFHLCECKE